VWRNLLGPGSRVRHTPQAQRAFEAALVADLRTAAGRYPADQRLRRLGVSRALGYQPNGESLHARGERADVMVHMRLQRADWLAGGGAGRIQISGFEACRPLFGLTAN
jgi:hypothetical protein